MSYELFRNDVLSQINSTIPKCYLDELMNIMDKASEQYTFDRKEVAITVYNNVPEYVKMYIAAKATENLKKHTLENYYNLLKNFFITVCKPITEITANDIRLYLFSYKQKKGICDRTVEQLRIYLNGFFDWCLNEEVISKNPVSKVQTIHFHEKQREVVTASELERMRFACKTLREKAIIDVLYSTGCRVSEMCQLRIDDIDWETRSVHILHGKGDKERTTYLNAEAMISLQAYLNSRTDMSPYVFVGIARKTNGMLKKCTIEQEVKNVAKRAGITKHITPHNLRHTFATTLLRNGCPVEHVQKMLGHAKISTTMIYARINDEDVRRNHEKYAI